MRLTNYHREHIQKALLGHAFDAREKELRKQFTALSDEIWATVIGPHQRAMEKLPAWFFDKRAEFRVENRNRGDQAPDLITSRPRLFPTNQGRFQPTLDLKEFRELDKKLHRLDADWGQMREERKERAREISSTLRSFNTVEALLEGWPEVKAVVPAELVSTVLPPMVVDVKKLNVSLGLGQPARAN